MRLPDWMVELQRLYRSSFEREQLVIKTCIFCGNKRGNLEVSLNGLYNCWVCGAGGRVQTLLRTAGIPFDPEEFKKYKLNKKAPQELVLPKTVSLFSDLQAAKLARSFLHGRGVSDNTIVAWDMSFATGDDASAVGRDYFGYVVVPLYGVRGLELFCSVQAIRKKHYHIPPVSKDVFCPKRRNSDTLIVVEGLFDGTAAWEATSFDVLMLLGTAIQDMQLDLLEQSNYKRVYMCLDNDAYSKSLRHAQTLAAYGQSVYIVKLPEGKDPNDCQHNLMEHISNAEEVTKLSAIMMRRRLVHGTL